MEEFIIDYTQIRNFYNNHVACWSTDLFSRMTTKYIDRFVNDEIRVFKEYDTILNAGSGGKVYKTVSKLVHLDIAENTLCHVNDAVIGNIVDMPFSDEVFDCVICVGTVINYCEAEKAIKEIRRILKRNALFILEYERSGSGLISSKERDEDILIFHHEYFSEPHQNFLYSDAFVERLLLKNGFKIVKESKFNVTIPWSERFVSEKVAHALTIFEPLFQKIEYINQYAHNRILVCKVIV